MYIVISIYIYIYKCIYTCSGVGINKNYTFHNFKSFTYVYDHQVNKNLTNISRRYFNITTDTVNLLNN